jgi:excisionase family DNA binding protein
MTIGEVAEHVDRPVRTVLWWAKNDRLPATKVGNRYVVDAEALPIAEELAEHRGRRAEASVA